MRQLLHTLICLPIASADRRPRRANLSSILMKTQRTCLTTSVLLCFAFASVTVGLAQDESLVWKLEPKSTLFWDFSVSSKLEDTTSKYHGRIRWTVQEQPSTKFDRQGMALPAVARGFGLILGENLAVVSSHLIQQHDEIRFIYQEREIAGHVLATVPKHELTIIELVDINLPSMKIGRVTSTDEMSRDLVVIGLDRKGNPQTQPLRLVSRESIRGHRRFLLETKNQNDISGPIISKDGRAMGFVQGPRQQAIWEVVDLCQVVESSPQLKHLNPVQLGPEQGNLDELAADLPSRIIICEVRREADGGDHFHIKFSVNYKQTDHTQRGQLSITNSMSSFGDSGNLLIDKTGKVISCDGTDQLPFALGRACELPLVYLGDGKQESWSREIETSITYIQEEKEDRRFGMHHMGFNLGPFNPNSRLPNRHKTFAATETMTYRRTGQSDQQAAITETYVLRTLDNPQRPTHSMNWEGSAEFDRATGSVLSRNLKGQIEQNSTNISIKVPIEVSLSSVSATEVAEENRRKAEATEKTRLEREAPLSAEAVAKIVSQVMDGKFSDLSDATKARSGEYPEISAALKAEIKRNRARSVSMVSDSTIQWLLPADVEELVDWAKNSPVSSLVSRDLLAYMFLKHRPEGWEKICLKFLENHGEAFSTSVISHFARNLAVEDEDFVVEMYRGLLNSGSIQQNFLQSWFSQKGTQKSLDALLKMREETTDQKQVRSLDMPIRMLESRLSKGSKSKSSRTDF